MPAGAETFTISSSTVNTTCTFDLTTVENPTPKLKKLRDELCVLKGPLPALAALAMLIEAEGPKQVVWAPGDELSLPGGPVREDITGVV